MDIGQESGPTNAAEGGTTAPITPRASLTKNTSSEEGPVVWGHEADPPTTFGKPTVATEVVPRLFPGATATLSQKGEQEV